MALVAGTGPLGAAAGVRLAALGASVAVLDRRPDALAHRIGSSGGHVLALPADPADDGSVRAAVGRLLTAWERIDIVVAGAGGLDAVCSAVTGYLPEAARTGSRGVADLVVLGAAGTPGPSQRAVESFCDGLRQQLAGDPVRVEVVTAASEEEVTEQVLQLIGRPAKATAGVRG